MIEVPELRTTERFLISESLQGRYGSGNVTVLDVSSGGAQIEHSQPIRLGTQARFWFKRGDVAVNVMAQTIWSRLSKTPNAEGKYLYRTGLHLEQESGDYSHALQALLDHGILTPDQESLERKKQKELDKIAAKSHKPTMKMLHPEMVIPPDQQLLIEHARKQLLAHPEEAQRWYQRAKYAITQSGSNIATEAIRNREDVLAVWEYLERSVEISTIATVFERMRSGQ